MKIYTKTGDSGATALFGGQRVSKTHPRIEAYGTVDELNSALGLVRSESISLDVAACLTAVQHQLFEMGAQLATPSEARQSGCAITEEAIQRIEGSIDQFEAALSPLSQFILPAGIRAASLLHVARTICRRAERRVVALAETPGERIPETIVVYLNRLSDLLFVLARYVNHEGGTADQPWIKPTATKQSERTNT